jgi:hypothetical protein
MVEVLKFEFEYSWEPFTFDDRHLTFQELRDCRLSQDRCSHWGAVVYKWEGLLTEGKHAGRVGVLIGETEGLRQRIKQYTTGTQESGNKRWREDFLGRGDVRLHILKLVRRVISASAGESLPIRADLTSNNLRLVLEQLLVMRELTRRDKNRWIVNRKL